MADRRVTVDEMADAIMDGLLEYAELATDVMKDCVKKAGNTVRWRWWYTAKTVTSSPTFWRKAMRSAGAAG